MLSAEQAQNLCRGSAKNTKLAAKVIFIIFVANFNGIGIILNMFRKSGNRRLLLALVIVALAVQMLQGKDIVAQIEKDSGGQVTITARLRVRPLQSSLRARLMLPLKAKKRVSRHVQSTKVTT